MSEDHAVHRTNGQPLLLWPAGAPHAISDAVEDRPRLTPYIVEANNPTGAVVVCPGGGYAMRADHEGEPIAKWLNSVGISAFVLDYRVAPYRYPTSLLDAQRAIRTMRHHAVDWNIDPHRVGILGFSAGGHLAATAGTHYDVGQADANDVIDRESCRPDALILCYAVISFGEHRHHGSMVNLIGEQPPEAIRASLSNELQVTSDTPPTFLWHTADDEAVPVENALLFAHALSRHRVPFELHVYEKGVHGLGLAPNDTHVGTWSVLCGEWLKKWEF